MSLKHYNTSCAYIFSHPLPVSGSLPHSTRSKNGALSSSFKPAWPNSSAHKRLRRQSLYSPFIICSAKDPRKDDKSTKKLFNELKIWFKQKEERLGGHQKNLKESGKGVSTDDTKLPIEVPDVEHKEGKRKGRLQALRWPWQNGEAEGTPKEGSESEAPKRITHSDSKPGSLMKDPTDPGKREETNPKITLRDRFQSVTRIIAPRLNREDTPEEFKSEFADREDDGGSVAEVSLDGDGEKLEETRSSIRELYEPPRNIQEENKILLKPEEKSWFRLPWKRKAELQEGTPVQLDAKMHGNDHESKPDVEAKTVDTSEEAAFIGKEEPKDKSQGGHAEELGVKVGNKEKMPTGEKAKTPLVSAQTAKSQSNSATDIITIPQRDVAEIRLIFGSETFFATETVSMPGGLIFRGNLRGEPKATLTKLEERLSMRLGDKYKLCLAEGEEDNRPVVVVVPTARDKRPAAPRHKVLAIVIGLLTLSTCLGRGLYTTMLKPRIIAAYGPPAQGNILHQLFGLSLATSLTIAWSIILIVLASQVAQRLIARRHRTRIAIPFFLPSYQLGTFGSVVQIASPTPTRSALFDIAAAGMTALVTLSAACFLVGLRMSTTPSNVIPVPMSVVSSSMILGYLTQQVPNGSILIDYGKSLIGLHPLAVIGANCLTIAALNLLPIRQLDGGRIIGALYGRKTAMTASRVTMLFLLLASSKTPYFIMFLAAMSFGPWSIDRPSRDEITEPNALRTIVGYVFMLLMIGLLLPHPPSKFFGTA